MKKLRKNNKGFSLVELIVVIAIMGILAVTLAPRLTEYVEKSRRAKDREIVNAIMTATSLGFLEEDIFTAYTSIATQTPEAPAPATAYSLTLNNDAYYTRSTKTWTAASSTSTNAFIQHLYDVVGGFTLSSKDATANASITISYVVATQTITVQYDADGGATGATAGDVYTLTK